MDRASLSRQLPAKPTPPGLDGFHNVNFSADGMNLPDPSAAGAASPTFTMKVYKGSGVETVEFQQ